MSPNTLQASSIHISSEDDAKEDDDEDREQEGNDEPFKKKEESKSVFAGQLRFALQRNFKHWELIFHQEEPRKDDSSG